ncbi:hypothetical protein T484DRAFT_2505429 [Baffinella frigidus]|nr:hypothetical protein T484DRAFT_2505429 [Cryptophyta sp. CCMP2293]
MGESLTPNVGAGGSGVHPGGGGERRVGRRERQGGGARAVPAATSGDGPPPTPRGHAAEGGLGRGVLAAPPELPGEGAPAEHGRAAEAVDGVGARDGGGGARGGGQGGADRVGRRAARARAPGQGALLAGARGEQHGGRPRAAEPDAPRRRLRRGRPRGHGACAPLRVVLIRTFRHMRALLGEVGRLRDLGTSLDAAGAEQLQRMRGEAARLLVDLLHPRASGASPAAPRRFWRELFAYAVPLIEGPGDAVFSSPDIYILLQSLQDVECSFKSDRNSQDPADRARVQAVRLALARGLSVALQAEARYHAVGA